MNSSREMLPLTEAFYYILVALCMGPSHGYGIMLEVEKMSNGRVKIGAGTLYTALSTLLKRGLIQQVDTDGDADSRRKTYAVTANGRQVLMAELERLEELLQNGRKAITQHGGVDSEY